jgi:hypothetical protein
MNIRLDNKIGYDRLVGAWDPYAQRCYIMHLYFLLIFIKYFDFHPYYTKTCSASPKFGSWLHHWEAPVAEAKRGGCAQKFYIMYLYLYTNFY